MKRFLGFMGAWWKGVAEGLLECIAVMIPLSAVICALCCAFAKEDNEET